MEHVPVLGRPRIDPAKAIDLTEVPYTKPGTIILGVRGSLAHGVYIPSDDLDSIDDKDLMGVVVPTFDEVVSLSGEWHSRGTREVMQGDIDLVEYEIRKFFKLALGANPNVLSLFWLPESYYLHLEAVGRVLLGSRELFLSRRAIPAFTGYAHGQIDLMRRSTRHGFRGEKRRELIERFRFDCKNAAHAIRLMRMGIELVRDGLMRVDRTGIDADELLAIKQGKLSLEDVEEMAASHMAEFKAVAANTSLPEEPQTEKALEVMRYIVAEVWETPLQ